MKHNVYEEQAGRHQKNRDREWETERDRETDRQRGWKQDQGIEEVVLQRKRVKKKTKKKPKAILENEKKREINRKWFVSEWEREREREKEGGRKKRRS